MKKKVTMTPKPKSKPAGSKAAAEQWIQSRSAKESMKRLTIDVPVSLHQRIKSQCAMEGVQMADVIREMLSEQFGDQTRALTKRDSQTTQ